MLPDGELTPGLHVSRETLERMHVLEQLILRWTRKINLIAPSSMENAWRRHLLDSAQLWALAPTDANRWIDLGSGAGLPGLVLATIAAEKAPDATFVLVEADQRKAAFLRHAGGALGIAVKVVAKRIEDVPSEPYDVVTARALAPLPRLLDWVHRFVGERTVALLPKGARVDSELTEARRHWHIRCERVPSLTDPEATILQILELEPLS